MNNIMKKVETKKSLVSKRISQTLDPCVVLMKDIVSKYAEEWENREDKIYSLAQGVVYWEPPEEALEACKKALTCSDESDEGSPIDGVSSAGQLDVHLYGPANGLPELVSKLEEKLSVENGINDVSIMVTAGANQAYMNCVLTLMDGEEVEGAKAVVFAPYYFNHVMALQMHSGQESIVVGPSIEDDEGKKQWIPDIDWLQQQLSQSDSNGSSLVRMVTVVNPGNPTGVSIPLRKMQQIADLCHQHKTWLVVDNTYEHFDHVGNNRKTYTNKPDIPFQCCSGEHVINIFSFSKSFSLAGFRVGYLTTAKYGDGIKMFEEMIKVQDTIPICVSRLSQKAAVGAISAGRKWAIEKVKTLDLGRNAILDALSPLEYVMGGTGAMYVMGKLPDGYDDVEFATNLVKTYGVAIIPGSFCGYPGWIRVCYSNLPSSECLIAASRLASGIQDLAKH